MSRRRIYVNGKPDWAENEPGFRGRVSGYGQGNLHAMTLIGGAFVQGEPGEVEQHRRAVAASKKR
jgi:hypothetical protein